MNISHSELSAMKKVVANENAEMDVAEYLLGHMGVEPFYNLHESVLIACGRFQTILKNQRSNLSGKFTEENIQTLMDLRPGVLFCTQSIESLVWETSTCLQGVRESNAVNHKNRLIKELRALSYIERLVLLDAVEQAWYRAPLPDMSIRKFFLNLEIELI